jgi:hypothetical protein
MGPEGFYRVRKNPPLDPIVSQFSPIHTLTNWPILFKIHSAFSTDQRNCYLLFMKSVSIRLCAAENRLSARYLHKNFTNVREIKSVSKLAVQRIVVFRNGVHVSVCRTGKPEFYAVPRCVTHLKDMKNIV